MAGTWDRLRPEGTDGEGGGRYNVHLLESVMYGYYVKQLDARYGVTKGKAFAMLYDKIPEDPTADELADLNLMANTIDAYLSEDPPNIDAANIYLNNLNWLLRASELGLITEAEYRNDLQFDPSSGATENLPDFRKRVRKILRNEGLIGTG